MIYKKFQDIQLSALGMGTMRLPVIGGKDGEIDEAAAFAMYDYALEHGVNYFDKGPWPGIPGSRSIWPPNFPATT